MDSTVVVVWMTRIFLIAAFVVVVALAALPLHLIVRPVITEAVRARALGDWWAPFLRSPDGAYGPLADNHWWSMFRASEPGSAGALIWRWSFWVVMSVLLTAVSALIVIEGTRLLWLGWT